MDTVSAQHDKGMVQALTGKLRRVLRVYAVRSGVCLRTVAAHTAQSSESNLNQLSNTVQIRESGNYATHEKVCLQ